MQDIEFTINGESFIVSETHKGFCWEHLDAQHRVITDKGFFATAAEAQQDAMYYAEALEEDEEAPAYIYCRDQRINDILGK